MNQTEMESIFGPVISSYSRAQAIEDGFLIDVSKVAREAGITFSVAVTNSVWAACVEVPKGKEGLQDEAGRLWDVLWMLKMARASKVGSDLIHYRLSVVTAKGRRNVTLKALCGPGDDAEPVITVMLPEED